MPVSGHHVNTGGAVYLHPPPESAYKQNNQRYHAARNMQRMNQYNYGDELQRYIIIPGKLRIQVFEAEILQYHESQSQQQG